MPANKEYIQTKEEEGPQGLLLTWVSGLITALDWSGRLIAVTCLAIMFVALLVNVVLRYALGTGITWAYEIHAILLPWLVAGGIVIATARGRHIAVNLMSSLLSGAALTALVLIVQAALFVISISILWSSQPILKASTFQTLATLGIKQVWGYSSLAYAFGAMALIALLEIVQTLAGKRPPEQTPEASLS
ncbi:MAG TPA: TRAP transporter small permease subunit [Kiloniellales bacterium]|nr:TRAP transporter small permease subunit [Kiloniellales bacterium]